VERHPQTAFHLKIRGKREKLGRWGKGELIMEKD
jgi:hypothetical protein